MRLFATIVCFFYIGAVVSAEKCGTCGDKSGAACVNSTFFALCDSNTPTTYHQPCPAGMFCVNDPRICSRDNYEACTPSCGACVQQRFACLTNTTFQLCFGQDRPYGLEHICPVGKVCSTAKWKQTESTDFCFDSNSLTENEIDCSTQNTPIIPTPPLSENASRFCGSLNSAGRYSDRTDNSCKRYYNCYNEKGKITGLLQQCGGGRIFDQALGTCVSSRFYSCNTPPIKKLL